MTCLNEFPKVFTCFRALQIYDLRPTWNKLFYLIGETKTMSIWRNKPLEHIIVPKPFITPEEQDFIIELNVEIPKPSSYLNDEASFWENLDDESYYNLQNAMERWCQQWRHWNSKCVFNYKNLLQQLKFRINETTYKAMWWKKKETKKKWLDGWWRRKKSQIS